MRFYFAHVRPPLAEHLNVNHVGWLHPTPHSTSWHILQIQPSSHEKPNQCCFTLLKVMSHCDMTVIHPCVVATLISVIICLAFCPTCEADTKTDLEKLLSKFWLQFTFTWGVKHNSVQISLIYLIVITSGQWNSVQFLTLSCNSFGPKIDVHNAYFAWSDRYRPPLYKWGFSCDNV